MGRYVGIEWPEGWQDCGRVRGGAECPRCRNLLVYATPRDGSFGSIVGCDNCLIMSEPGSQELVVISARQQHGTELVPYVPAIHTTVVPHVPSAPPVPASAKLEESDALAVALLDAARELIATGMIEYVNGSPHFVGEAAPFTAAAELRLLSDLLKLGLGRGDEEAAVPTVWLTGGAH